MRSLTDRNSLHIVSRGLNQKQLAKSNRLLVIAPMKGKTQ